MHIGGRDAQVEVQGRADRCDASGDRPGCGPGGGKRHGVSEQTIYTWKKRFGSFQPDDVRRLKQLQQANTRRKTLVAERDPDIEVMKETAGKKR